MSLLDLARPYQVTAPDGKVHLLIKDVRESIPSSFALMGTRARDRLALRIAGGCSGMSPADKQEMLEYFAYVLDGYGGVIWSGATRAVTKDGEIDPMVTEVPGVIAGLGHGAVALGTAPRTDLFSLQGDSRFVLDEYGTVVNPALSGVLLVQNGADSPLDWDGDVPDAFTLTQQWVKYAGLDAGWMSWNGGGITLDEVRRSVLTGYPTFVVRGSGRESDNIAEAFRTKSLDWLPEGHKLFVGDRDNPDGMRQLVGDQGFLLAA